MNVIRRKRGFISWLIVNLHCGYRLHRIYTIDAPKERRAIGCLDCLEAGKGQTGYFGQHFGPQTGVGYGDKKESAHKRED